MLRFLAAITIAVLLASYVFASSLNRPLRPFDRLAVSSTHCADWNFQVEVSDDGCVWLPNDTRLRVGSLGMEQAETAMRKALGVALNDADFELRYVGRNTSVIQFSGAVKVSGSTPVRNDLRLFDVLRLALPTASADLDNIEIEASDGLVTKHRFVSFVTSDLSANPKLRPGDYVYIPVYTKSNEVLVLGEVGQPGSVEYVPGLTASQAVLLAGGPKATADIQRVQVERAGKVIDTLNFELKYDVELQRGDVLRIPTAQNVGYVFVAGAVSREERIPWKEGMRLTEVWALVEGKLLNPDPNFTIARRVNGELKRTKHNLEKIRRRQEINPILQAGDIIEIQAKLPAKVPSK